MLLLAIACIAYVSSFDVPLKIVDAIHSRIAYGVVPSELAHILCGGMAVVAFFYNRKKFAHFFSTVYTRGMIVKASLIVFTLMPDANPECGSWSLTKCLTRNDMLPSGHMLVSLSSALVLGPNSYPFSVLAGFLLVASHMHYCVDVILSVWIVFFLNEIQKNADISNLVKKKGSRKIVGKAKDSSAL